MSQHDDFDRSIALWLDAEARPAATSDVLDGALRATRRRRPRPRLLAAIGSHWAGDSVSPTSAVATLTRTGVRASMAPILLLLVLALVAGAVLVGARLVQPAPATGRFALAYGVDGDVFLADADGSSAVRIADGDSGVGACDPGEVRAHYTVNGTAWSPDGRYLAYWDWRGCPVPPNEWGTVIISDEEGKEVASFPGQGWAISWSPDSTRVAVLDVWAPEAGQDVTIGVYALDGTRQAVLTVPSALKPDSGDYSPVWSRDGSSILLPGVLVPLDGDAPTPSQESGFYTGCCAYSPDGSRQAIVDNGSLVVEDADKPDAQKAGPTEFWKLAWSPNGDLIAFEGSPDPLEGFATELLVRDVATGADTSILDLTPPERLHVIEFSADGEQILFNRADADDDASSLWSIGADGSAARRLVDRIQWADLRPQGRP